MFDESEKYLDLTLEELEDLCGGVPAPRAEIDFIHYFCGEDGVGDIDDESCSHSREKLYKQINRLVRAYAEIKGEMGEAGYSAAEQVEIDKKVVFYIALKDTIGNNSGDFLDLKAYEAIERFVWTKASWIKRQVAKFDNQARQSEREYVSGETLCVWGKQYYLQTEFGGKNALTLSGDKAVLTVHKESTPEQREIRFIDG